MKHSSYSLQQKLFKEYCDSQSDESDQFCSTQNTSQISSYPYKPKSVRLEGKEREGQCSICHRWYKLRTSSYWYHMNYKHGISSNNLKISNPHTRIVGSSIQGYCEICEAWIALNAKNTSHLFGWYKHFQKFHGRKSRKNSREIKHEQRNDDIPYKRNLFFN